MYLMRLPFYKCVKKLIFFLRRYNYRKKKIIVLLVNFAL